MKKLRSYVIGGSAVLLLGIAVVVRFISGSDAADSRRSNVQMVKVEKPIRETVDYKLEFNGDIVAIQQASIFSKVTGNIDREIVDMGTFVHQNQLLAVIDTTELYQQIQQTSATYINARLTYDRTKKLLEQSLVAKQDLDNAEAAMKVAKANYDNARTKLGYARITAPFSGFITKRYFDVGALVTTDNSVLFSLMDLDSVKVIVNVLEKDIPVIAVGKEAIVTVDAFPGKNYEGKISKTSQAVDLATRTMSVEIDIPNKDRTLKPGMFATVTFVISSHPNAVTVPTYSLLKDNTGQYVFALSGTTAKKMPVVTGIEIDARTEILSGLDGDETIITTGQQLLRDGGHVLVQR